jgi:hypothetical protein
MVGDRGEAGACTNADVRALLSDDLATKACHPQEDLPCVHGRIMSNR